MNFFLTLFALGVITFLVVAIATNKTVISIKDELEEVISEACLKAAFVAFLFSAPLYCAAVAFFAGLVVGSKGGLANLFGGIALMHGSASFGVLVLAIFGVSAHAKLIDWRDSFRQFTGRGQSSI